MNDARLTRQSFLRAALALAGAIGGGATLQTARASEVGTVHQDGTLRLQGRGWHLFAQNRVRGELPVPGDQVAIYGELFAGSDQNIGEFYSSGLQVGAPMGLGPLAAGAMEVHTFNLSDGTILGMGSSSAIIGAESAFAVVGGTGRYAGASGDYTARQDPLEVGGTGTAEFMFRLNLVA
jgi:hypothetical protein